MQTIHFDAIAGRKAHSMESICADDGLQLSMVAGKASRNRHGRSGDFIISTSGFKGLRIDVVGAWLAA